MKNLCRIKNNRLYSRFKKSNKRFLIVVIIFLGGLNFVSAKNIETDTLPQPNNLFGLQHGINKIYNAGGIGGLKIKMRKSNSQLTVIKVLHIGDSHIKAGYLSETFINKMNGWYGETLQKNIFFNAQSFCKTGTKYADYAELAELDQQLISDKPDLVIISLGTNDAFSGSSKIKFYDKVHHLVNKIKTLSPASILLLTTPADALKKNNRTGVYEALPELQYVVSVIISYANDHHIAYWNVHQLMGGNYSINNWVSKKLAAPDRVHFTQEGYTIIGTLLFEALKNSL